jgi:hypothetical protein
MFVVPTHGVFKSSLILSAEEEATFGDNVKDVNIPRIYSLIPPRAARIVRAAVVFDRDPATASGSSLSLAMRPECGPEKARIITRHDIGVNAFCRRLPLEYPPIEDLAAFARPGYHFVGNDHSGAYNAIRVAVESQPFINAWHPTIPDVIVAMTTLDFGLGCGPFFFSTFTAMINKAVAWWLSGDGKTIYYLDDNGVLCRAELANPLLSWLDAMSLSCGWEYALAKRQNGLFARCIGRRFDVNTNSIWIVLSKVHRTLLLLEIVVGLIDAATADATCSVDVMEHRFLDKLTGTLGWLASCSYVGLLHMGPFYYAVRAASRNRLPRLSRIDGLRAACVWWLSRAASGRLRAHRRVPCVSIPSLAFAFDERYQPAPKVPQRPPARSSVTDADNIATIVSARRADGGRATCLQCDAGANAWALIVDNIAFWGLWETRQQQWSSGGREFYPPLQALLRRPELFRDAFVVAGFDNASDAVSLCLGRTKGAVERRLLSAFFECADDLNAELVVWWCTRRMNAGPDQLSKCDSLADARRWCSLRRLELVVCNDIRDDYVIGSLARSS